MLRVSVDIIPHGFESGKRNLYIIEITNIGVEGVTSIGEEGEPGWSYRVRTIDEFGKKEDHGVLIEGFNRSQPAHVLVDLVYHTLIKKGLI